MKKILLIFVVLIAPFMAYADGDSVIVLPEHTAVATASHDGDKDKTPVHSTKITDSMILTDDILPLSFELMVAIWQKSFDGEQCSVFQNTDLLTPFATKCISVPFSALKLLDMCKEQVEKNTVADNDAKEQCMSNCGNFVMGYLRVLVDNNDLVSK